MKVSLAVLVLISVVCAIEVPRDFSIHQQQGSRLVVGWKDVTGASGYVVRVSPAVSGRTEFSHNDNHFVFSELVSGQRYTIDVKAVSGGDASAFCAPVTYTPSGIPFKAPPPHVVYVDDSSVSLTRRNTRYLGNGYELTKVFVLTTEEGEHKGVETEYDFQLPISINGLKKGKTYTFSWRFGNEVGTQSEYSPASRPVDVSAPTVPPAPEFVQAQLMNDHLRVTWRPNHRQHQSRILRSTVRLVDAETGATLSEKTAYRPIVVFDYEDSTKPCLVYVTDVNSMGASAPSDAVLYNPSAPAISIAATESRDLSSVVHLNVTTGGSVICSYYSSNIRPKHASATVHSAGVFPLHLEVEPSVDYTVECSLHANGHKSVVRSEKGTFTTPAETFSHLEITDIEPFSTFARFSVRSDVPGPIRCMPIRKDFGEISPESFVRFSRRYMLDDAHAAHQFVATKLTRGYRYNMRCAHEAELVRAGFGSFEAEDESTKQVGAAEGSTMARRRDRSAIRRMHPVRSRLGRRLQDVTKDVPFQTLDSPVPVSPKVIHYSPDLTKSVEPGTVIRLTFDTPVRMGTGKIFVGEKGDVNTPVVARSVSGLFVTFLMPSLPGTLVQLRLDAGAFLNAESNAPSEAFAFTGNDAWEFKSSVGNSCMLMSDEVPPMNAAIRYDCDRDVVFSDSCRINIDARDLSPEFVHVSGKSFAILPDWALTQGRLEIHFNLACRISKSDNGVWVSASTKKPVLESVKPVGALLAGDVVRFTLTFDAPITFVGNLNSFKLQLAGDDEPLNSNVSSLDTSTTSITFDCPIKVDFENRTLIITLAKEAVHDVNNLPLDADVVVVRKVGDRCGPTYLSEKAADAGGCKCKRSNNRCECQCGTIAGVVEY